MISRKELLKNIKVFITFLRRGIGISVVLSLLFFLGTMWQVERAAKTSSEQCADAAIILGAAAWGKNPSPVFRERIRHGVDLYKQGCVGALVFTGGTPKEGYQTEAQVGKDYAIKQGVPERDIIIEDKSRDTYDNFVLAKKEINDPTINSFLVVSDPYHMYRSMMIAKDAGYIAYPSPTPSTKYSSRKLQVKFLFNETLSSMVYKIMRLFH